MSDHGASTERTRLAWRRTALSATVVGLLAARPAFRPDAGVAAWLAAAGAMTAWAVLIVLGYRRVRGLPVGAARTVLAYAAITAGLALLGGLVVIL